MPQTSNEPHIEVMHSADIARSGKADVAHLVDMDRSLLAMPAGLRIGQTTWDGRRIADYGMQVDEYRVWLEDQIKAQDAPVLEELDRIYNLAISQGVILTTIQAPAPNVTHAHVVRDTIMELASQASSE